MTTDIDHNKLLKKLAKERLKPFGIFQQGQSRTFLYDKGWFTIVIEFQPSSWSKGTYLNIGVDFNFYPRDYFVFGYGYREKGFEEFKDEDQFKKLVHELCDLTIKRVQELDIKFQDTWAALHTCNKEPDKDAWRLYELAVLNALTSNVDKALTQLKKVSNERCEHEWEVERKQVTDKLIVWLQDEPAFLDNIKELINETRQLKKLPTAALDDLIARKTTPDNRFMKWRSYFKI